ncbi:MAG: GGDEF domain-containing protein [Lachnospiraceae bacterium]|nr:GGDEF domain-containing protein [Lachnospiraceae bacterium]
MKKHKHPLNRSITIGCIIFIILLCVLLSIANHLLFTDYVYDDYQSYIGDLLELSVSHIDGDDLKECIETGEESEQYKESLLYMDNLMDHIEDIHYLYAVLPLNREETGNVMSVFSAERYYDRYVDTEGNLYLGWISEDEFEPETVELFFTIMNGGDETTFFEEDTEWGIDYTGAIPIRDSEGNAVALLAVDVDMTFLKSQIIEHTVVNVLVVTLSGFVFILLFLLWSRRNITKPIVALEESAEKFVDQSQGQRDEKALVFEAPEVHTDNEVEALSDAVIKMTEYMREYVHDIVNAEKKAANMQELANRDALTGIRNKTAYDQEFKRMEGLLRGGETKIGLAMVDLNFLKKQNDTYGHEKGNLAIQKLCRMVCVIFDHSPVFRIGGDEFVIILRGNDYDEYERLEHRFQTEMHTMEEDDMLNPWEKVSASIGAAFYDPNLDDGLESVFRRADQAMYENKVSMKASRD